MNDSYAPREVIIEATIRIEDDSDPNNQFILYGLRCAQNGPKGLVINGFGSQAEMEKDPLIQMCICD